MYEPGRLRAIERLFLFSPLPGEVHPPRTVRRGTEAIELVLSGRGAVHQDGAWLPVRAGDLAWHQEGERTLGRSDPDDPYRCLALRIAVEPGTPRPAPRLSRWADLAAAAEFSREALLQWIDPRTDRALLLHRIYASLLSIATAAGRADTDLPAGLVRVRARIDAEYDRNLSVEDLARTAGLRPQRLHEVCRRHLGRTPHQLIHERRLQAVRELLIASDLALAEVAGRCGFASAATLCRAFRLSDGTSPAAWRRRRR